MNLILNINYRTNWGERLFVEYHDESAPDGRIRRQLMTQGHADAWTAELEMRPSQAELVYRYAVIRDDGSERHEWGADRRLAVDPHVPSVDVFDRWQDQPSEKPLFSSAFTDCICRPAPEAPLHPLEPATLMLRVKAPMVLPGMVLAVSGSCRALGEWDPAKALVFNSADFPEWSLQIPLAGLPEEFDYKLLLLRKSDRQTVAWERCDNRHLSLPRFTDNSSVCVTGLYCENPLPHWRGAGVAIPVFSLRTRHDFGVGDFFDLIPLIDWAASTGQRFIQLLPINDTTMTGTWTDSYPYNANSTFALHPMYLRLEEMGQLHDVHLQSKFDSLRKELNDLPAVDYERVNAAKREYTLALFRQQGKAEMTSPEFKEFVEENSSWLYPYAAFCVLRDRYRTPDTRHWEEYSVYSDSRVARFISANRADIDYVLYIQYHLHRQMTRVRDYAHSRGVALKGDIPIGISRDSVDAWLRPELFNLDVSAGAPPDDFSVLGQNWGFPTYNWEVMARDGFAWWKARFRKMAQYFDAYRIDHVLGFFRIWQIPLNAVHGLLGVFNPALPLTPADMLRQFGFSFSERFTTIMADDTKIDTFFTDLAPEVKATFFDAPADGSSCYTLRPQFATQRQIADYFGALPKDDRNTRLCESLLSLLDDVLFIEDPYQPGRYHPRIAAQSTYTFRMLDSHAQWCFNRLYDDFYYHRHNDFWYGKAMWKLPPLIDSTSMLVCAEDLGMIPACVPAVMHRLEILSLEIQRMPKDSAQTFGDTWHYPYLSVCTTSTHDMAGIRRWWEENPAMTQRYYNEVLHRDGASPFYAEPWICRDIIDLHLKSPSMLCILPLQDWLSIDGNLRRTDPRDEQINVPANPRHYWRYRMHLTAEDLLEAQEFNSEISELISQSGR